MQRGIVKKLAVLLLAGGISGAALGGCAGNEEVEQTNKSLTLCVDTFINDTYQAGFEEFKKEYPDVELNVEVYDDLMAGMQRVNTQIMAGEGPDLLLLQCYGNTDVYKIMRAQAFAPLDDFIREDSMWNAENYAQAVLDAGVYDGKQMVMPLSYYVPVALTSQQTLEKAGISLDSCNDFLSFMQETAKFYEMDGAEQVLGDVGMMGTYTSYLSMSFLDYSEEKLGVEKQTLQQACEAYKNFYEEDVSGMQLPSNGIYGIGEGIAEGRICMYIANGAGSFMEASQAEAANAQPVLWPFRNGEGQVCASIMEYAGIRANSENRQNAWNLLKILLGENVQRQVAQRGHYCPMLTSVLEEGIDKAKEQAMQYGASVAEMAELPAETMRQYKEALMNPGHGIFVTDMSNTKFVEYMKPFYLDEGSYEDCIGKYEKFIKIYLTE